MISIYRMHEGHILEQWGCVATSAHDTRGYARDGRRVWTADVDVTSIMTVDSVTDMLEQIGLAERCDDIDDAHRSSVYEAIESYRWIRDAIAASGCDWIQYDDMSPDNRYEHTTLCYVGTRSIAMMEVQNAKT